MKAMLSIVVAIICQASVRAATNFEITCPASVVPSDLPKSAPAGWQSQLSSELPDPQRRRARTEVQLLGERPTKEMPPAILMPSNAGSAERDHYYVWHFNGHPSIWVSCTYADGVQLFQAVPGLVHMCQTKSRGTVACSVTPE